MRFDIDAMLYRYALLSIRTLHVDQQKAVFRLMALVEALVRGVYTATLLVQELETMLGRSDFVVVFGYAFKLHRGWTRTAWTRKGSLLVVVNRGYLQDCDALLAGPYEVDPEQEVALRGYQEALDRLLVVHSQSDEVTIMTCAEVADAVGLDVDDLAVETLMRLERLAYTGTGWLYLTDELVLVPESLA